MPAEIEGAARWLGLAGWIGLCFLAAAPGVLVTTAAEYQTFNQPSWAPPASLFGPAWTVLYVLMGVGAWLVWREGGWSAQRRPLTLFFVQLALNAAWTPIFFGAGLRGLAFAVIVALWGAILATALAFRRVRPLAAGLLLPYLAWVAFAAALNFAIWRMNGPGG